MKKAAICVATALVAITGVAFGQTTSQHFDNAIQTAENIQQDVQTAQNAVNQLVIGLTITGTPDAEAFENAMYFQINHIQNNADDIDYFTGLAHESSPVAFSTAEVNGFTAQLVVENDELIQLSAQITEAINNNDNASATALIPGLQNVLAAQSATAGDIISVLEDLKATTTIYQVDIQLVDAQGNNVYYTDLFGYYAYNHATSEYLYPEDQEGDSFFLAPGTYTFDSFNGYFSGTGSATVTLSSALVNENGVIVVELVYWSE